MKLIYNSAVLSLCLRQLESICAFMVGCKRKRQATTSESGHSDEDSYDSCSSSGDNDSGSSSSRSSSSHSDASSSESAESESASVDLPLARLANLSFNSIFQAEKDSSSDEDIYQRHGKSKTRISAALKKRCCKGRCKRNLKPIWKSVCYLVACFWALSKQGQDGLLWSLQNPMFIPQTQEDESNDESEDSSFSVERHTPKIRWLFEGGFAAKIMVTSVPDHHLPPPTPQPSIQGLRNFSSQRFKLEECKFAELLFCRFLAYRQTDWFVANEASVEWTCGGSALRTEIYDILALGLSTSVFVHQLS